MLGATIESTKARLRLIESLADRDESLNSHQGFLHDRHTLVVM
jgi:hypothetical protein